MITHRDKKPYECHLPECEKSYSDLRSLKRHMENHRGIPAVSSSPTAPFTAAPHSSTPTAHSTSKHLLTLPTEDRNNNMKGVIAPERPSSAPSGTPEVRTRARIRSNSCEDISVTSDVDVRTNIHVSIEEPEDDIFGNSEARKNHVTNIDEQTDSRKLSNSSEKSSKSVEQNLHSPHNNIGQQWANNQYPAMPGQSLHNMQWSNAQMLANLAIAQGQNNLPFFMGYRQQFQQFYPNHFSATNDQMEPTNKKVKTDNIIGSTQNSFPQNALQMFASMAAQRAHMPTDMLLQQRGVPFFTGAGHSNLSKPTDPTAIAIAAAKDGSMFCMPNDARLYGAHPGAAQWQDVSIS